MAAQKDPELSSLHVFPENIPKQGAVQSEGELKAEGTPPVQQGEESPSKMDLENIQKLIVLIYLKNNIHLVKDDENLGEGLI